MNTAALQEIDSDYFIPEPSAYPILTSIGLLGVALGATSWINGFTHGKLIFLLSAIWVLAVVFFWFAKAINESELGLYSKRIDISYRWSMSWFIFSEIMFFAVLFGALFYTRVIAIPWLSDIDHKVLWPDFSSYWPTNGPAQLVDSFKIISLWPLPTVNTFLLLSSGATLTWSHLALQKNQRSKSIWALSATILLGCLFVMCQAYEYIHAYSDLNLRFDSGIYGSTFFMLTGFHGLHVIFGLIILSSILLRLLRGHFNAKSHFGFEAAAWYWHFVDFVWLGLYFVIYVF